MMGIMTRPSNPALQQARDVMQSARNHLVDQWTRWVAARTAQAPDFLGAATLERQFGLLIDILIELAGPRRRQGAELWFTTCDSYGRMAAIRGLAAGEVVEEIQHLRELLIRHLSEAVFQLSPRQSMAVVLRLNGFLDKAIAHAVVGYTDTLVETLLDRRGIPIAANEPADAALDQRLTQLEEELERLRSGEAD